MSKNWRWFLLGYLWALPQTLLGFILAAIYGVRLGSFKWHQGVLTCVAGKRKDGTTKIWFRPGAQTHGWLVIFADEWHRDPTWPPAVRLRVHEYVHVAQAFVGGPLYTLGWGINWLAAWVTNGFNWRRAYESVLLEQFAYKIGDSYVPGSGKWGD